MERETGGGASAFAEAGRGPGGCPGGRRGAARGRGLAAGSLLRRCTAGLRGVLEGRLEQRAPAPRADYALPDGRLDVGPHLPLLGSRYRVVRPLGEGVTAQVLLAQDTFHPAAAECGAARAQGGAGRGGAEAPAASWGGDGHVVLKVLRRQFFAAGTHEARLLGALNAQDLDGNFPVVRLLDAFDFAGHACLVLEGLSGGSLIDFISDPPGGPGGADAHVRAVRKVAMQIMQALLLLHEAGVVHSDLKPENVLLCGTGSGVRLRVVDFGIAQFEDEGPLCDPEVQSLQYRAPEVVRGGPYGRPIDAWSTGCILAECALRRPLFACGSPEELAAVVEEALGEGANPEQSRRAGGAANVRLQAQAVRKALNVELPAMCPALGDLVRGLLRPCPRRRLEPLAALFHPFLAPLFPLRSLFCRAPGGAVGLAGGFTGIALTEGALEEVRGFGTAGRGRFGAAPASEGADPEGEALFRSLTQERQERLPPRTDEAGTVKPEFFEEEPCDHGAFDFPRRRETRVIKLGAYDYDGSGSDDEPVSEDPGLPEPPAPGEGKVPIGDGMPEEGAAKKSGKRRGGPAAGAESRATFPPPTRRRAVGEEAESPAARRGRGRAGGGTSPWWMA